VCVRARVCVCVWWVKSGHRHETDRGARKQGLCNVTPRTQTGEMQQRHITFIQPMTDAAQTLPGTGSFQLSATTATHTIQYYDCMPEYYSLCVIKKKYFSRNSMKVCVEAKDRERGGRREVQREGGVGVGCIECSECGNSKLALCNRIPHIALLLPRSPLPFPE